jgi:hypothetical protein
MTKKEKDRQKIQEFIERFRKRETNWLVNHLHSGIVGNPFAHQAINIILKERGSKGSKGKEDIQSPRK